MKNVCRYIVTDIVSIPVCRIGSKGRAYKYATVSGWGCVDWYSAVDGYKLPVNRDTGDKTQVLLCDEDSHAVLYPKHGREFVITTLEEINLKNAPSQAETGAIIIGDPGGYSFWAKEDGDIKIFVTYDENGLIDSYRLDNWAAKPYDGETEITFDKLQSEEEYEAINRADIRGTLENTRLNSREAIHENGI
jgi:hypothetical protein